MWKMSIHNNIMLGRVEAGVVHADYFVVAVASDSEPGARIHGVGIPRVHGLLRILQTVLEGNQRVHCTTCNVINNTLQAL